MFIGFRNRGIVIISAKQYKELVTDLIDQYYREQDHYLKYAFMEYKSALVKRQAPGSDTEFDQASYWEHSIERAIDEEIAVHDKILDIKAKIRKWAKRLYWNCLRG